MASRTSRTTYFFAMKEDAESVLSAIEAGIALEYTLMGGGSNPDVVSFSSWHDIPNLGVATRGTTVGESSYLVSASGTHVSVREVPQVKGGTRYMIDQLINPRTIELTPGGVFKDTVLIAGRVATCSANEESLNLYRLFASEIRRRFRRIASFWVGPEAERFFDAGHRLTTDIRMPMSHDLSRK